MVAAIRVVPVGTRVVRKSSFSGSFSFSLSAIFVHRRLAFVGPAW